MGWTIDVAFLVEAPNYEATAEKPSYKAAFCAAGCTPSSKSKNYGELGRIRACLSDGETGWETS
jgi:hypothetical protein